VATAYSGPLDYLNPDAHWLVRHVPAQVRQRYAFYHAGMLWAEPDLAHAIEGLRWVHEHLDEARERARRAAIAVRAEHSLARIGEAARQRLLQLAARNAPPREVEPVHPDARPPVTLPIPGGWYDADYFENGLKSNWSRGYSWPLFRGLFIDSARFLKEIFPEVTSALDIGCAKGFLVRALRDHGVDAWGFDHSRWAIEHANPQARPYLALADAESASYDRRFDLLVAMSVLESLTEVQLRRALPRWRAITGQALLAVIETRAAPDDRDLSHVTIRGRAWWRALFADCGWHQDAVHRAYEATCQRHAVPARMRWDLFLFVPS
jgi:2-polyprenyl-3-methyl-5-hydroxy-6-metoxy-1,4-benzoquinol methylase